MKKYIACLLAAILLLTMLPASASASAEGRMQACHRVTAKYTDSKQSNKSGIRLWSVKTALTSVDDEINGLAQAYADKIAPTLQAGKANGDKNSRLDVEIRHSKTGLTWMSFLVQARTTYHRDLIAQEFTSRTFDMTTGERILLTDIFPEGSEGWTILREKLEAQINYYFPDETPDPDAVAQVLSDEGLRNLDFTLHGMSLVIHLSADAFYPEHHTLIETTLFYPDIREYMTEKAQIETDNLSYYKTVALTFDDGPTGKKDGYPNGLTNYLLDGLKQRAGNFKAGIVLMGYLNPFLQYGLERFAADAAQAGVSGCIVPDLPLDESAPVRTTLKAHGIDLIALTDIALNRHGLTAVFLNPVNYTFNFRKSAAQIRDLSSLMAASINEPLADALTAAGNDDNFSLQNTHNNLLSESLFG